MDLEILKNYLNNYSFDDIEPIFMPIVDCNFEYDNKNYCLCLVKSIGTKYSRIEEFIPVAIYNSLESIYRDCEYESYITEIKPQFINEKHVINTLKELDIRLKLDVKYSVMLFEIGFERFIVGELIDGNYFSIVLLNINSSYSPKNINN